MATIPTRAERIAKAAELVAIGARTRDPRRRRQLVEACARLMGPRRSH